MQYLKELKRVCNEQRKIEVAKQHLTSLMMTVLFMVHGFLHWMVLRINRCDFQIPPRLIG